MLGPSFEPKKGSGHNAGRLCGSRGKFGSYEEDKLTGLECKAAKAGPNLRLIGSQGRPEFMDVNYSH